MSSRTSNHSVLVSRSFATVTIIAGLLLFGLPALFLIVTSVRTNVETFANPFDLWFVPNFDAFRRALKYDIQSALTASLKITLGSVAVVMLLAIPAAYGLARATGRVRDIGVASLILLQLLPATSLVIPLYQVLASLGLFGNIAGVVAATSASMLPFAVMLLRPFFLGVPREIEEAAAVDGAGRLRTFLQISLPVARNGVLVVSVLIGMIAWGDFLYPISFLTDPADYPLSTLLAAQVGNYGTNWPRLMSLAILMMSPLIMVFLAMEKKLSAGLSMGAVK
jgi:multiple sugar transport system permease protein